MKVIDFQKYRDNKKIQQYLSEAREPLYKSHNKEQKTENNEDFGHRLQRIRNSLEKINRLMHELKQMSKIEPQKVY